ncbi:hypothetical protein BKA64DRAFT_170330 [Cadophora sp. MPI-SDFR-AT-0126]|nr:hypothetical protein BKA64DRAFT_170330 [Leotiomycetes sp. MPI-SDFR-AT-0126]
MCHLFFDLFIILLIPVVSNTGSSNSRVFWFWSGKRHGERSRPTVVYLPFPFMPGSQRNLRNRDFGIPSNRVPPCISHYKAVSRARDGSAEAGRTSMIETFSSRVQELMARPR